VRRRAIAYLHELGQADQVPPEYLTPLAAAEGDLAAWLAEPHHIGLPPHELSLFDHRLLRWPGFDDPIDCYLLRYTYRLPAGTLRSVGIVGPTVHALTADLSGLAPDDVYAIYAGWHAEHREIAETAAEHFSTEQGDQAQLAARELQDLGYDAVRVLKLGEFFGDPVAVAAAELAGEPGMVVMAGDRVQWFPGGPDRPRLGADEVYCLFKGRALLAAFNEESAAGLLDSPRKGPSDDPCDEAATAETTRFRHRPR